MNLSSTDFNTKIHPSKEENLSFNNYLEEEGRRKIQFKAL